MDELRGPNIQVVLHIKEGLGFGFLRNPFIVAGALNGYMLETDPVVPSHTPLFDAELVWEADKRRFRSLRVQNVPIKIEVFTTGSQGRKDKVGYLLLSLLGAQPCPSNKVVDLKYSWHRLLGVKSEGKCCHPQLLMTLSVEDRISTPTPRNELRMFHSNEIAYPSTVHTDPPKSRLILLKVDEYIAESKKTVSSPNLQPRLICDDGLIQIGTGNHVFVLSFVIGAVENLHALLPEKSIKDGVDCYVSYSVFTHNIMTDRIGISSSSGNTSAQFNQRTSLRVASELTSLAGYFTECPHLVIRVCAANKDIGICSVDLRKLTPTDNEKRFVAEFCNEQKALTIHERCYLLNCQDGEKIEGRRPFIDIEMTLKYIGLRENTQKPKNLTARSASQLERGKGEPMEPEKGLEYRSGSCTIINQELGDAYTNMDVRNTARYKNASGNAVLQTNEIAELLKKMCDSFALSQEKLLASHTRPVTSDMQVQCEPGQDKTFNNGKEDDKCRSNVNEKSNNEPNQLETSKSDTCIRHHEKLRCERDMVNIALSATERDAIMQRFVDELEDWKEKQQELFKCQLKRKEDYHLDLLAKEWSKKRVELECKLTRGIEQCRNLAEDLSRATDDFRLRGYRNTEREKKLLEAKKALEAHYTAKYQELREASQKMEDDMNHQLKLKNMRIEELELKVLQLEKNIDVLKNNLKSCEKESENKYSGLTKDQTASLIQELRSLEEKLDSAVQSKSFFKEQWGRAVRELHAARLHARREQLNQLRQHRTHLANIGLDTIQDQDEDVLNQSSVDIDKLKNDFYVDILANSPAFETPSMINMLNLDEFGMFEAKNMPKNPMNERINELITQRDRLVQGDNPDEELLRQLNHEIRTLLVNCGS